MFDPDLGKFTVMDFDHQLEEEPDMDTVSRLKLRVEFLASELKAALQDNPTGEVDLYPTLEKCTTLHKDMDEYYKAMYIKNPHSQYRLQTLHEQAVYDIGQYFGYIQHVANPQQLACDIRVTSLSREHLRVYRLQGIKDYYSRIKTAGMHQEGYRHLESFIYYLGYHWSPNTDLALILTNNSTLESYHVISLHANWNGELSDANAIEGQAGDIYFRTLRPLSEDSPQSPLPVFIMYRQGNSSLTSTSAILPETTEESNAVGLQATENEGQPDYLTHVTWEVSESTDAAAPVLDGGIIEMEVCRNTSPKRRGPSWYWLSLII